MVHITHKGPVSDCGIGTYHPCVALGELHRQQSAPVAVVASSSRVQRRWKCSHSRKKKRNIGIFGPHHSQGASFRLRDRYISPMHCSQRARPRKLGACGGCCSLVSCTGGEGNVHIAPSPPAHGTRLQQPAQAPSFLGLARSEQRMGDMYRSCSWKPASSGC